MADLSALGRAGADALRRGDFTQAIALFEQTSRQAPGDAGAWFGLALAHSDELRWCCSSTSGARNSALTSAP